MKQQQPAWLSPTSRFTSSGLTVTVLCNALDGMSWLWVDGIASILAAFSQHGAPARACSRGAAAGGACGAARTWCRRATG